MKKNSIFFAATFFLFSSTSVAMQQIDLGELEEFAGEYRLEKAYCAENNQLLRCLYRHKNNFFKFDTSGNYLLVYGGVKDENRMTLQCVVGIESDIMYSPEKFPLLSQQQETMEWGRYDSIKYFYRGEMAVGIDGYWRNILSMYRVSLVENNPLQDQLKHIVDLKAYNMFERVDSVALSDDRTKIAVLVDSTSEGPQYPSIEIYMLKQYLEKKQLQQK